MATGVISLDNAQRLVIRKALKDLGLESISDQVERILLGKAPPIEVINLVNNVTQLTKDIYHNQVTQLFEKRKEEYFGQKIFPLTTPLQEKKKGREYKRKE